LDEENASFLKGGLILFLQVFAYIQICHTPPTNMAAQRDLQGYNSIIATVGQACSLTHFGDK